MPTSNTAAGSPFASLPAASQHRLRHRRTAKITRLGPNSSSLSRTFLSHSWHSNSHYAPAPPEADPPRSARRHPHASALPCKQNLKAGLSSLVLGKLVTTPINIDAIGRCSPASPALPWPPRGAATHPPRTRPAVRRPPTAGHPGALRSGPRWRRLAEVAPAAKAPPEAGTPTGTGSGGFSRSHRRDLTQPG